MSAPHWDVLRRFVRDVAWLVLVGYPLARALTALVLAWTAGATDPLAGVR